MPFGEGNYVTLKNPPYTCSCLDMPIGVVVQERLVPSINAPVPAGANQTVSNVTVKWLEWNVAKAPSFNPFAYVGMLINYSPDELIPIDASTIALRALAAQGTSENAAFIR